MRKVISGAIALVLVGGLAGCGGGSDDTSDASGGNETTTTAADGGSDGGPDGGTDDSLAPGDVPFLSEDCQFLLGGAFLNPLATAVPGANADLGASADQLAAIAEAAPEEIRDAMATVAEGFALFAEALKDVDLSDPQAFSDPAVLEKLEELDGVLDEDYEAASQAVSDYIDQNCAP